MSNPLAKFVGFLGIASLSGLAYLKYSQYKNYGDKIEQMTKTGELEKYLFNAAEQSSYFVDDMMNNFEASYNASHIRQYKATLLKFVNGKTLETCAGSNRNLSFYPPGTDLTLLDWSPKMASMGLTKNSPTVKTNYVIADVTRMPFPDNEFDTVVDIFGLDHVLYPAKALEQIRRVCKKDGTILLMNQGLSSILEFHYWQNAVSAQKLYNTSMFTNRNWEKLIKEFDFKVQFAERKKNGNIYVFVLKNTKEKQTTASATQGQSTK